MLDFIISCGLKSADDSGGGFSFLKLFSRLLKNGEEKCHMSVANNDDVADEDNSCAASLEKVSVAEDDIDTAVTAGLQIASLTSIISPLVPIPIPSSSLLSSSSPKSAVDQFSTDTHRLQRSPCANVLEFMITRCGCPPDDFRTLRLLSTALADEDECGGARGEKKMEGAGGATSSGPLNGGVDTFVGPPPGPSRQQRASSVGGKQPFGKTATGCRSTAGVGPSLSGPVALSPGSEKSYFLLRPHELFAKAVRRDDRVSYSKRYLERLFYPNHITARSAKDELPLFVCDPDDSTPKFANERHYCAHFGVSPTVFNAKPSLSENGFEGTQQFETDVFPHNFASASVDGALSRERTSQHISELSPCFRRKRSFLQKFPRRSAPPPHSQAKMPRQKLVQKQPQDPMISGLAIEGKSLLLISRCKHVAVVRRLRRGTCLHNEDC